MQVEWISIKDRLPEKGKAVLLAYNRGMVRQGYLRDTTAKNGRKVNPWQMCGGWTEKEESVTHWMPLPDPPKSA